MSVRLPNGEVRPATSADGDACAAIYAPYVEQTAISFETHPPSGEEMAARIVKASSSHAWLVLEDSAGIVVGYAYGGLFAARAAYRWSCEVSVYIERGHTRSGVGRRLYEGLFEALAARGYQMAFAGMTLPNAASEGLHRAMGFEPAGVYRRVGFKHGAWHDVAWLQRPLGDGAKPPAEPV
jgi:L-amino acid N-acyltransferase YncA